MSMTPDEAAYEAWIDELRNEMAEELSEEIIAEFTVDRLQSYYRNNPKVMRSAIEMIQEAKKLEEKEHFSASLVFFVSANELLLKSVILRPIIYGLIHNETVADVIVEQTITQTGIVRYLSLLKTLFNSLVGSDLNNINRVGSTKKLLDELKELQKKRNQVIHRGQLCTAKDTAEAHAVSIAIYESIVKKLLFSLDLDVINNDVIFPRKPF